MHVRRTQGVAAVTVMGAVLTGCTGAAEPPAATTVPSIGADARDRTPTYAGRWTLAAIDHAGTHTTVPAALDAYVQFDAGGHFGADDTVNVTSGTFTPTPSGFVVSEAVSTAVGYIGTDATRVLVIRALDTIVRMSQSAPSSDSGVTAGVSGRNLVLNSGSYELSFTRSTKAHEK